MATIGEGRPYESTTVTNAPIGTWWTYLHGHAHHVHAMAYCEPCDAAYCSGCNRQWGGRAAYTSISTGVAGAPAWDGSVTVTNAPTLDGGHNH